MTYSYSDLVKRAEVNIIFMISYMSGNRIESPLKGLPWSFSFDSVDTMNLYYRLMLKNAEIIVLGTTESSIVLMLAKFKFSDSRNVSHKKLAFVLTTVLLGMHPGTHCHL